MSSNDVALKIRDNNWFITIDDKVLCSVCDVTKDFDADEVDDDSNAWYNKGIVLDNLGRYEEALQVYDKALELKPNDFDAPCVRIVVTSDQPGHCWASPEGLAQQWRPNIPPRN